MQQDIAIAAPMPTPHTENRWGQKFEGKQQSGREILANAHLSSWDTKTKLEWQLNKRSTIIYFDHYTST